MYSDLMSFDVFLDEVVATIPEYLSEYDIDNIRVEKVVKNNGISCTGVVICLKDEIIAPNIYMEYYYNLYSQGHKVEDILDMIKEEYLRSRKNVLKNYKSVSWENIDDCLAMKLVNYQRNEELLKTCPHKRFCDLAIIFRFIVKKDDEGIASALITNRELEEWNISLDELYEMAKKTTMRLMPPRIASLKTVLGELLGGEDTSECYDMQVLSCEGGINGAIYFTYPDIIMDYADSVESDLYIIPSSIHEVLLLPVSEFMSRNELDDMVKDVNSYAVDEMEYLSDHVYYFSREKRCVLE